MAVESMPFVSVVMRLHQCSKKVRADRKNNFTLKKKSLAGLKRQAGKRGATLKKIEIHLLEEKTMTLPLS